MIRKRIGSEWLGSEPAIKGAETSQLLAFFTNLQEFTPFDTHTQRQEETTLFGE